VTRSLSTLPPSAADDFRERELRVQPEPACFVACDEECECCGETSGLHGASCAYSDDELDHGDEGQAALNSRAWLGERGCV
jgi:hypothetical protein